VADRKKLIAENGNVPDDFLSSILKMQEAEIFTDEQVIDQATTFLFAGPCV
jgi:cytochrome P450